MISHINEIYIDSKKRRHIVRSNSNNPNDDSESTLHQHEKLNCSPLTPPMNLTLFATDFWKNRKFIHLPQLPCEDHCHTIIANAIFGKIDFGQPPLLQEVKKKF